MIGFIVMGGSCSLAGTWWDRKIKKDKKEDESNDKKEEKDNNVGKEANGEV